MTTQEVADRFYEMAQLGQWDQIQLELYAEDARSIEPAGAQGLESVSGLDKIRAKGKAWEAMIQEVHSGSCNRRQVAGNFFAGTLRTELTFKGGQRQKLDEVALYEVREGKIVTEQFFF